MILAFDPGITTGVALLQDDGSIIETQLLTSPEHVHKYCWKKSDTKNLRVVVEKAPELSSNYREYIEQIEQTIKKWFKDVTWITPGQWKGHPVAQVTDDMKDLVIHERDAVGLGRYFQLLETTK